MICMTVEGKKALSALHDMSAGSSFHQRISDVDTSARMP